MQRICWAVVFFGLGCQSAPIRPGQASEAPTTAALDSALCLNDLEKRAVQQSADFVSRGQEGTACMVLLDFLTKYPDRCDARLAYAELLLQMKQLSQARTQFEVFLEHGQEIRPEKPAMLTQANSRLTDIAEGMHDLFHQHLHRGIGLYLTARNFQGVKLGETFFSKEKLLNQAQSELTQAHEKSPDEAQPCWYLYCVYRDLGQMDQAERFLRRAQQCAAKSRLTREEKRQMQLAVKNVKSENGGR